MTGSGAGGEYTNDGLRSADGTVGQTAGRGARNICTVTPTAQVASA